MNWQKIERKTITSEWRKSESCMFQKANQTDRTQVDSDQMFVEGFLTRFISELMQGEVFSEAKRK